MNDKVQNPLEPAARIYCAKAGIDPDEQVPEQHPIGLALPLYIPRWQIEAERLLDLSVMLTSLREAAQGPKVVLA